MGTQPPSQKGGGARGRSPQFSAHVYCGQTAGWIKTALGMEVGLGPRPTSMPWAENMEGGSTSFVGRGLGPHLTQSRLG